MGEDELLIALADDDNHRRLAAESALNDMIDEDDVTVDPNIQQQITSMISANTTQSDTISSSDSIMISPTLQDIINSSDSGPNPFYTISDIGTGDPITTSAVGSSAELVNTTGYTSYNGSISSADMAPFSISNNDITLHLNSDGSISKDDKVVNIFDMFDDIEILKQKVSMLMKLLPRNVHNSVLKDKYKM